MALSVAAVSSWPWVQAYAAFSGCLLSGFIYNVCGEMKDPLTQTRVNKLSEDSLTGKSGDDNDNNEDLHAIVLWCHAMDSFCLWVLVNTLCCFLLLMAKYIQFAAFGDLRINEKQNLRDKIWNFLFHKLIFLLGVLNVQSERDLAMWCLWLSGLLFLQLLAQLCKDRLEYLSSSSSSPTLGSRTRVVLVLMCLFASCVGLTTVCGLLWFSHGTHALTFLAVECLMLTVYMSHAILRYTLHLYDQICDGSWESKDVCIYYTDFFMEMGLLFLDMMHHIHMLLYGSIWFSVADLFILTRLRFLSQEIHHKLHHHENYLYISNVMDKRFSVATMAELASHDDRCAICWEKMYTAYKLPCRHLFHKSCLRSWLEQNMSCPTCRMAVNVSGEHSTYEQEGASLSFSLGPASGPDSNRSPINSQLFHFDGTNSKKSQVLILILKKSSAKSLGWDKDSQIANWLPGFSVEFLHSPNLIILLQADDSQVNQEEEMFPQTDLPE